MDTTERDALLHTLEVRFQRNTHRHPDVAWSAVRAKLDGNPAALRALREMEATGGEPDVVSLGGDADSFTFCDCAAESPLSRRSCCYDQEALDSRKENKPANSAVAMAGGMGITLLTEAEYRALQALGAFDLKTSSWISTPESVKNSRNLGRVDSNSVITNTHRKRGAIGFNGYIYRFFICMINRVC